MKSNKQIKRNVHVSLVDNVIYIIKDHIVNISGSISFKTNEKFDLVAASHKLNHISPSNKLIYPSIDIIIMVTSQVKYSEIYIDSLLERGLLLW